MEKNIIDYILVAEHDHHSLTGGVQELIKKGYEPIGGIAVVSPLVNESPAPLYVQALIKREA